MNTVYVVELYRYGTMPKSMDDEILLEWCSVYLFCEKPRLPFSLPKHLVAKGIEACVLFDSEEDANTFVSHVSATKKKEAKIYPFEIRREEAKRGYIGRDRPWLN